MPEVTASSDIIVIGAGIVGSAIAFELASRGASVRLVDDRAPGMGATQASAGMLAPHSEAREGGPLQALTVRGLDRCDAFIARASAASGMPLPYRRTGTLDVAIEGSRMRHLQQMAEQLHAGGVDATLLDAKATRSEEPHLAAGALGGLLIGGQGFVSATDLTNSLVAAASRLGALPVLRERVTRIRRAGGGIEVGTEHDVLSAGAVVLAAGSWSGGIDIEGVSPAPVKPIRGQMLRLGWEGPPLRRVTWSARCYVVPWDDGTLLVGATVEDTGFDERTTVDGVRGLMAAVEELLPQAKGAAFLSARAGLRPATPDELPIIGPSTVMPNLTYATGHYRNGVLLAPLTAELVADAMLDGRFDPLLDFTRPARFGAL